MVLGMPAFLLSQSYLHFYLRTYSYTIFFFTFIFIYLAVPGLVAVWHTDL